MNETCNNCGRLTSPKYGCEFETVCKCLPLELAQSLPSDIRFNFGDQTILRLSKDGFYYKGERINDVDEVYKKFSEWLKSVTLFP